MTSSLTSYLLLTETSQIYEHQFEIFNQVRLYIINTSFNVFISRFSDLKFDREILTRGSLPPIYCTLCIKDGHLRSNCPQASIGRQPVGNRVLYPTMDRLVNDFCFGIVQQYSLSPLDIKVRDEVCFGITEYLRVRLNPRIVVSLFGSSRNGFGFRKSDMDMCLTIKGNKTGRVHRVICC